MFNHAVPVSHYSFVGVFCFLYILPAAILLAYRGLPWLRLPLYEPQYQGKLYARFKAETLIWRIESRTGHLLPDMAYSAAN
ncbi:hypothetical protein [Spirosoma gilvum]